MRSNIDGYKILNDIFNGDKNIAVFVVSGKHFYLIEDKINYRIKDGLCDFLNDSNFNSEKLFFDFCYMNNISIYNKDDMRSIFLFDVSIESLKELYYYADNYFILEECSYDFVKWEKVAMRLPDFYINFSKKLFFYRENDRDYSDYVPSDWRVGQDVIYGLFIPDDEQYWIVENMNFWKLQL